jgi:hypothetical protein
MSEARRAVELSPNHYLARIVLVWGTDATRWAERQRQLTSAPGAEGYWGKLSRGGLLLNAGRLNAGFILITQAVEGHDALAFPLAQAQRLVGRPEQAGATLRRALATRPNDEASRRVQLDLFANGADPDATLALLDDPARRPAGLPAAGVDAYRAFARWKKAGGSADATAARGAIESGVRVGAVQPPSAVPMLVALGDLDGAFDLANAYAADPRTRYSAMFFDPSFLFLPETAPMRRDRRLIDVVRKLGLIDYWRASGLWPDFCQTEPDSVCAAMKAA